MSPRDPIFSGFLSLRSQELVRLVLESRRAAKLSCWEIRRQLKELLESLLFYSIFLKLIKERKKAGRYGQLSKPRAIRLL